MTTLARFDPWREALSLRDAMDRLFEQSFVNPLNLFNTTVPGVMMPMDVYETKNGYEVKVLLPGINPDHLELTVQGETLTIKGEYPQVNEQGKEGTWLVHEIGSGSFQRTITFPKPIDASAIESSYRDGVLTITVPFSEASKPRRISITGGQTVESGSQKQLAGAH
jgi:HSP20 family protein